MEDELAALLRAQPYERTTCASTSAMASTTGVW
jgi:hypothetical protein